MNEETIQSICAAVMKCTHEVYPRYMQKVNDIDIDYFDLPHDCEMLPETLFPSLKSHVVGEMRKYARTLLQMARLGDEIAALSPTPAEMDEVRRRVHSNGLICSLDNGDTDVTDRDLERLYRDAQRRNLWERLFHTNKEDVHRFFLKLQEKTYEECKDVYYSVLDKYLEEI